MKKILLVGNPNVGKSVIFSKLTGVNVAVSNYPGKPRRLGRSSGYTSAYKKASVTLKEGQTIEIAEGV